MKTIDAFLNEFEVTPNEVEAASGLGKQMMMFADTSLDVANINKQKIRDAIKNKKQKEEMQKQQDAKKKKKKVV